MLCHSLPPSINSFDCFSGVEWSTENTLKSQTDVIEHKCGIPVKMHPEKLRDVDEIDDWLDMCDCFGIDWKACQIALDSNASTDEVSLYRRRYEHVFNLLCTQIKLRGT